MSGEREHERILAAGLRGIVAAPHRHLAEAEPRVERLRAAVARPYLEEEAAGTELARELGRLRKERAPPGALMRGGDRKVEQMALGRGDHEHEIAEKLGPSRSTRHS